MERHAHPTRRDGARGTPVQSHDKTLTIVGGAMLSTCLIVGGVAAVSGNTPTRPAEVVGIDGVRGASEEIARVDKTKRFPQPAVASDEQEAPSTTPLPAPGPAPAPPKSDNGPVRVPPAAPTPTDARQQALPQPADGGDARRAPAPPPASPS